jgi:hypothetical protein
MSRSTLPRYRFQRTSAEGGGGGTGQQTAGTGQQTAGTGQQTAGTGPEMVKDDDGSDAYPANTAIKDMSPEHRAEYWRIQSKTQQRKREEAERKLQQQSGQQGAQNGNGSGTVTDQQKQSTSTDADRAREEGRREGQRDAVLVSMSTSLQLRGLKTDEITELLEVVNPDKFLDDGKVDSTKVANYLARVAPVQGNQQRGLPGQGNREQQTVSRKQQAKEAAQSLGLTQGADPNRGALGGLRK